MPTSDNVGRLILVVDDEPLVCESITRMLAVDGYRVETAASAEDALALFGKNKFDLIMTDYELPLMNGDELAVAIKAIDPSQPIALITAYMESLQSAHNPLAGVDLVIGKPFDLQELRQAVGRLLRDKRPAGPDPAAAAEP